MMGQIAGGGSMAVAIGVSDMSQVTGDKRHMTHKRLKKKEEKKRKKNIYTIFL